MDIHDVAKAAGVSIATVSRVINKRGVRHLTRAKVLEAIEKLGYHPSFFAQKLASKDNFKFKISFDVLLEEFLNQGMPLDCGRCGKFYINNQAGCDGDCHWMKSYNLWKVGGLK